MINALFRVRFIPEDQNFEVVAGEEPNTITFRTSRANLEQFAKDLASKPSASLESTVGSGALEIQGRNAQSNRLMEYLELVLDSCNEDI